MELPARTSVAGAKLLDMTARINPGITNSDRAGTPFARRRSHEKQRRRLEDD